MRKSFYQFLPAALLYMGVSGLSWAQLVALSGPPPWPQVNLLRNGSFERNTGSGISAWTNYAPSGTRTVVNDSSPCGDNVLQITDSTTNSPVGLISDPVTVTPGISYTAEAYIRRTDTNLNVASLYIEYYNVANVRVGSFSAAADAEAGVWDYVSRTGSAPSNAVTAKVLCYSTQASTGSMYFDGVSFRVTPAAPEQYTRYVSPSGTGTGTASNIPAKYNSTSFWAGVKAGLATSPVKVIFLAGDYVINRTADCLTVTSIGNATKLLTLEGEHPYGSVFTRNNAATNQVNMVTLSYATNVVVRHLHWEDDTTDTNKWTSYSFVITSGSSGQTRNIAVEGCSFVGLNLNYYGALGVHQKMTHDVKVSHCEFIRGGFASGFHMIYNAYGPYNLLFQNNYFQDCSGAYLRLRANTRDSTVTANDFVSTAASYNQPFVQLATYNDIDPGDEIWGINNKIISNNFTYVTTPSSVAINLNHRGFDPTNTLAGTNWHYLLTAAKAATLSSGTVAAKRTILRDDFALKSAASGTNVAVTITGNNRSGYHVYNVLLSSASDYVYTNTIPEPDEVIICPDYGGGGAYDISTVFPND